MTLVPSTEKDFNTVSFLEFLREESNGKIQLEDEKVFIAESVDSTSTRLKALLNESGPLFDDEGNLSSTGKKLHKTILASASQSSGYGRLSRSFYSLKNDGIYFSFIYIPKSEVINPAFYTVSSAVAVSLAVEELLDVKTSIKWVNDVFVDGKKVCGILSEGYCPPNAGKIQAMVIGIGINLHTESSTLPDEIKDTAGGILDSSRKINCNRAQLLAKVMANCIEYLDGGNEAWKNVVAEYKKRSYLDGKTIRVTPIVGQDKGSYHAKVLGITDKAELEVECEDGSIKKLSTGEVTLHQN
ncbi:MAG: biotin--[acetyl-CoA-carboxylase] ligase [Treponema sp.]|nr:biotin--[acetyl-CoA-carboxylase] ligase [Treponema sp.]